MITANISRSVFTRTWRPKVLSLSFLRYSTKPNINEGNTESITTSPPIPALPLQVQGWPSFWVVRKEVEEFLYPLYNRGWGIKFLPRNNYSGSNDRYVANLTTEYTFANFRCASQFVTDLFSLAENEKHHPTRFALQNSKRPVLLINVLTDSALRPRWNEEDQDKDPPLSRRVPGITRRDLRLAILLEQLYDKYFADGRALELRGLTLKHIWDRPSWEYFISRLVRSSLSLKPMTPQEEMEQASQILDKVCAQGVAEGHPVTTGVQSLKQATMKRELTESKSPKCMACGGHHNIRDCDIRSKYPPPTLCYFCLEPHWWLDCPARQSP